MHSTVVIKGNKAGMSVILDPEIPFEQLLEDVARKFRESAKFWGSVQMTLTLEGRKLSPVEELRIVDMITLNSQIEVLCLLDTNAERIERCEKALNEKLMELASCTGQFYRGNLSQGDTLESESSIVIIGDVLNGARVIAKGNIIVLGALKGTVYAGAAGEAGAVIAAMEMAPTQLRIADYVGKTQAKSKRLGRGPMLACIENDSICTKPMKKTLLNTLNFI